MLFLSLESHGSKIHGVKHYKVGSTLKDSDQAWNSPYKGLGKR